MRHEQPKSQFFIYCLHHPESQRVYIGKSSTGMARPMQHSQPYHLKRYAGLPRAKWVQSLLKKGTAPHIAILEECARVEDLDEAERYHIAYFRYIGFGRNLLNLTDGGDGIHGYRHSDKARAKMSAKRQESMTEEEVARLNDVANAYWSSEEAREKQRANRTGKKWSEATKAKTSASLMGKPKSAEHRTKIREAAKKRAADPVYREKQRQAQIIAQARPEVRAKKRAAALKQWDSSARTQKSEQTCVYFAKKREEDSE